MSLEDIKILLTIMLSLQSAMLGFFIGRIIALVILYRKKVKYEKKE